MTAKPDKLRLFYPSRDLSAHGEPLPDRTVLSGSLNTIVTESMTQESGYWENHGTGYRNRSCVRIGVY
jgi:hypothetical protein